MSSTTTYVALAFALCLYPAAVRADVIVSTGISLNNLQILPASGSLVILPGVLASASAQAQDSLGGNDAQSNTVIDDATSASAKEVRAIAALNHPHICQIHDIGPDYLVLEYIELQQQQA